VQSINIAERLRTIVNSHPVNLSGQTVTLTASFGVSAFEYTQKWSVSEFLSRADGFLFEAKTLGRNRVCSQDIRPVLPTVGVTAEEKEFLYSSDQTTEKGSP
jgi:diguanylate cyclase (GGDEF)-like protein